MYMQRHAGAPLSPQAVEDDMQRPPSFLAAATRMRKQQSDMHAPTP